MRRDGGDSFDSQDTLVKAPGQATVVVGDATGHGVGAALLMATARDMMRAAGDGGPAKDDVTLVAVMFIPSGASGPPDGGPERRGARD